MLTVRLNGINGDQVLFQAAMVVRGPPVPLASNDNPNPPESFGYIEFYDEKNESCHGPAIYGEVYVMNELGKTVAKWDLGGWAEPAKFPHQLIAEAAGKETKEAALT